ncbi:MAG: hypothetical protein QM800_05275 [Paludibacter sp.]
MEKIIPNLKSEFLNSGNNSKWTFSFPSMVSPMAGCNTNILSWEYEGINLIKHKKTKIIKFFIEFYCLNSCIELEVGCFWGLPKY